MASEDAFTGSYAALDYRFEIRTRLREAGEFLDALLAPFRSELSRHRNGVPTYVLARRRDGCFEVKLDQETELVARSIPSVIDWILWDSNAKALGSSGSLIVHAGAVSLDGMGVVLPAPPDSGKSTTVAGLIAAGFWYLSDEAALFQPSGGWLTPYPRPLWLEGSSVRAVFGDIPADVAPWGGPNYHLHPDRLRRGSIGTPCRLRFVVAPTYTGGRATRLTPVSRADGLVLLARNATNLASFGSDGIRLLQRALEDVACYRLEIANITGAVDAIRDLVTSG